MMTENGIILEGKPLKGRELESLKRFLREMDLEYDEGIEYSVCILNDEYEIVGTGSVDNNVIKCVAVQPEYQGQGLSARILSALVQYEFEKARTHIFIYTKPNNEKMFADMGFHEILKTSDILFMENRLYGFSGFMQKLIEETPEKALEASASVGAIVANCNPFTNGHRYLIEQALKECEYLHLFILSDDRSFFPAEVRLELVRKGIEDLERVILHQTSDYMISAATFPTYFFKDKTNAEKANCRLDLELFGTRIAKALHISKRFIGTEPTCRITKSYNEEMKRLLPDFGIEVRELARMETGGNAVSASKVRSYLMQGELQKLRELVPETVYAYLCKNHKL